MSTLGTGRAREAWIEHVPFSSGLTFSTVFWCILHAYRVPQAPAHSRFTQSWARIADAKFHVACARSPSVGQVGKKLGKARRRRHPRPCQKGFADTLSEILTSSLLSSTPNQKNKTKPVFFNTTRATLSVSLSLVLCVQFSSVSSRSLHAHSTTVSKDGSAPLGQHKY